MKPLRSRLNCVCSFGCFLSSSSELLFHIVLLPFECSFVNFLDVRPTSLAEYKSLSFTHWIDCVTYSLPCAAVLSMRVWIVLSALPNALRLRDAYSATCHCPCVGPPSIIGSTSHSALQLGLKFKRGAYMALTVTSSLLLEFLH